MYLLFQQTVIYTTKRGTRKSLLEGDREKGTY